MISVDVKIDIDRALKKMEAARKDMAEKAIPRALNKTADQAKVQAAREIRSAGYNLKIAKIKASITIRRASATELRAVVRASGRPIGLINYDARQTAKGVTVSVKKGRKLLKGAFIATMPNGHTGVFYRQGQGHKKVVRNGKVMWSGLPIDELFGPSIPSAFANDVVQRVLVQTIRERFPKILDQEMRYSKIKR